MKKEDNKPNAPAVEADPRFPSGKWVGFWLQRPWRGRGNMELVLTFVDGGVRGSGADPVGEFTMAGTYDLKSGKVSMLKTYQGAHSLRYEGQNEGDGMWIWGMWHLGAFDRGGFHIWPHGEDDPTARKARAEKEAPAPRRRVKLAPVESQ